VQFPKFVRFEALLMISFNLGMRLKIYHVSEYAVNNNFSQLLSVSKLGCKHASYRIKTIKIAALIDSPSTCKSRLAQVDDSLFTHHHFMGASNQYRRISNAEF